MESGVKNLCVYGEEEFNTTSQHPTFYAVECLTEWMLRSQW